jgi:hypothetical protein
MSPVTSRLLAFVIKTFALPTSVRHLASAIRLLAIAFIVWAAVHLLSSIADHPRFYLGLLFVGAAAVFVWQIFEAVRELPALLKDARTNIGKGLTKLWHSVTTDIERSSDKLISNLRAMGKNVQRASEWSWRHIQRLDPDNYLTAWWHEATLFSLGVAAFCISVHFLRIHQYAYFREVWRVMHLRVSLGDYSPAPWEMASFGGGFLSAMFAYVRLSQRLADAFWYWRHQRRITP